jgi:hypothetical protein
MIVHRYLYAGTYGIKLRIEYQKNVFLIDKKTIHIKDKNNSKEKP